MGLNRDEISLKGENGSSLVSVLIVITIISFLVGCVMMGMILQNRFIQRDVDEIRNLYIAEAGLYHFLADSTLPLIPKRGSIQVELMDGRGVATISAKPFGGFLSVTSSAGRDEQKETIRVLVGEQANHLFDYSIILGDTYSALNLAGTTSIKGDIATGPAGIKKSSFRGKRFEGSFNGRVKRAEESLFPEFDNAFFAREIEHCRSLIKRPPEKALLLNPGKINLSKKKLPESRDMVFVDGNLELSASSVTGLPKDLTIVVTGNLTLKGQIKFESNSRFIAGDSLKIMGSVNGDHALFYAEQEITIDSKQPFSGQLLANGGVSILGKSYLKYPSVIYTNGTIENGTRGGRVKVSGESLIEGLMLIPEPGETITEDNMRLIAGKGTKIKGGIYNTAKSELHGEVAGSVLTMQFYFYRSPTAYINWLKDVVIDVKERPENYTVPLGFSETRRFEVLEWQKI